MTRAFMLALAATTVLAGAPAMAQSSTTTTKTTKDVGATGSIVIGPEQQTRIKAFVAKEKRASMAAPSGFQVSKGATLPAGVEIYTFGPDVGVNEYRYTVIGNRTVLVEPGTRQIVQVID